MKPLKVIDIIDGTSVDGPGLRTTIYFAGCRHHCFNCHNPQSWDLESGNEMTQEMLLSHIIENDFDVTFSGGDPLLQVEQLTGLAKEIKNIGKNIWCYTGYSYEEITASSELSGILPYIDVLVDGRYIDYLRDTSLRFRGSSNQRLIDVVKTLVNGTIVLYED